MTDAPPSRDPERWIPTGFSQHVGFHDFTIGDDRSISVELDASDRHLNMGGIVHGGVLVSMLDSVMGGAVVATLGEGEWTATETLTTNFMRAASAGRIKATGRVMRRGKLTAFVSGDAVDETGRVLAHATGVWAIRK